MGFRKGPGKLLCNVNRKCSSRGTTRQKLEMCIIVADEAVVVFDVLVIRDVAKGFTLEFLIYMTTKCKQDDS